MTKFNDASLSKQFTYRNKEKRVQSRATFSGVTLDNRGAKAAGEQKCLHLKGASVQRVPTRPCGHMDQTCRAILEIPS